MAEVVAPSTPNKTENSGEEGEEEIVRQPEEDDVGSRRNARETAEALVRLLVISTQQILEYFRVPQSESLIVRRRKRSVQNSSWRRS